MDKIENTKVDAHRKCQRWLNKHSESDGWLVTGGEDTCLCSFSYSAANTDNGDFLYDSCIFRYNLVGERSQPI